MERRYVCTTVANYKFRGLKSKYFIDITQKGKKLFAGILYSKAGSFCSVECRLIPM